MGTIISEILKVAKEAAQQAGEIQVKGLKEGVEVRTKGETFDLVTTADVDAEKAISNLIKTHFPDHNILGEEDEYEKTDSPYLWIVDPIDGTNNYSKGLPYFSVSIAVWHDNAPLIGVVANAVAGETFWAIKGQGAYLNGKKIFVNPAQSFTQSLFITGFYNDRGTALERTLLSVGKFLRGGILGIRRFGSGALDLCYVAAGRAEAFFELSLNAWDFAAGALIAQEAGALVTDLKGQPLQIQKSAVIAAAPALHPQILKVLHESELEFAASKKH